MARHELLREILKQLKKLNKTQKQRTNGHVVICGCEAKTNELLAKLISNFQKKRQKSNSGDKQEIEDEAPYQSHHGINFNKKNEKTHREKPPKGPKKINGLNVFFQTKSKEGFFAKAKNEEKNAFSEMANMWKALSEEEKVKYRRIAEESNRLALDEFKKNNKPENVN